MMRILCLLGISSCLLPCLVSAHTNLHEGMQGTAQVGAAGSVSYFSEGSAGSDGYWRIAGNLMGGHALPVEKGFGLDDALIWGRYKISPEWQIHAKLATHNEGSHNYTANVDNFFLSRTHLWQQPLDAEFGLMDANFTPSASTHPSLSQFVERPLITDAFWGGSVHDAGLRITWKPLNQWTLGAELWSGDFFPATQSNGAYSLFAQTEKQWANVTLKAGVWGLTAKAQDRADDRYTAGHSHSTSTTTLPDVRFTGDTDLAGVWLALDLPTWHGVQSHLQYEYAQSQANGELVNLDQARKATYASNHKGMSFVPSLRFGQHELSYRYEQLSLNNTLQGAGAALLAEDANLVNTHTPKRQTLQWKYQLNKQLAARVAYTEDKVLADKSNRFNVGLVWQQRLYDR